MKRLKMAIEKLLLISLIALSSCQTYPIVERCDEIASMDICRCSGYDFNVPKKVGEPYSMPQSYCQEKRVTFSLEEWSNIVSVRESKAYLEGARSRKDLKKRHKEVSK